MPKDFSACSASARLRSAWFSPSFGEARRSASGAKAAAVKRRIFSRALQPRATLVKTGFLRGSLWHHTGVSLLVRRGLYLPMDDLFGIIEGPRSVKAGPN